jgi:hypothetical protein
MARESIREVLAQIREELRTTDERLDRLAGTTGEPFVRWDLLPERLNLKL